MGCCFSTSQKDLHHPNGSNHHHFASRTLAPDFDTIHSRAPPTADEERVKEVLSESPFIPPKPETPNKDESENKIQEARTETNNLIEKSEEISVSEVSQISEMYSMSESFSTATTITEKRDDEVVSKPRGKMVQRVNKSPGTEPRKRPYTGEPRAKSLARKTGPSRPVRGRESGQVKTRQRNVGSSGIRRDSGEISGRRSRSPATRTAGGGGRGGAVKTPMKGTGTASGRSEDDKKMKEVKDTGLTENGINGGVLPKNESLDNPLVSLECFIFL